MRVEFSTSTIPKEVIVAHAGPERFKKRPKLESDGPTVTKDFIQEITEREYEATVREQRRRLGLEKRSNEQRK